ncbi:MAG: hypothetical protein IT204_22975 [Fimbriimonadaceae bacterium]|nr:hypothetical protein [Fimbriimonadaceae bacterium]
MNAPWLAPSILSLALLQTLLLLALWLQVRRASGRARGAGDSLTALASQLEPPLRKLFGQLEGERDRLADQVHEAERLVAALSRLTAKSGEVGEQAEADELRRHAARATARRLLSGGQSAEQVATQTGLPLGEVQVLANLQSARETIEDALK